MNTPTRWLILFTAAAILILASVRLGWAAPPTPVITTPTPVPTATPRPLTLQEALLTPEAERTNHFAFLPFVAAGESGGSREYDVSEDAFSYTIQEGDTLWSLALDFGRDLDTMSCVTTPTGADAERLTPGQTVIVPALSDLCYTVTPGDTLAGIAVRHRLTVDEVVGVPWNGFASPPYRVVPRQRVLLSGARLNGEFRPEPRTVSIPGDTWAGTDYRDWPYGDGQFIWPVVGWISQGARRGHVALDIAVPNGTPVKAADRGTVVYAGWNPSGYGFRVVIDHNIDYVTLYAHLSDIYVEVGQVVAKGQVIGASGANGNVTGPHLHFELRDFGRLVNPLPLLH